VAFPRGKRALVGTLAVVCLWAAVPALLGTAGAAPDRDELAARLMRLDPGARVGGNTQVATAARAHVSGARGRVNFMIGLAPRQRIVGGNSHDQIGARGGAGARIRGAHGHDLIHGGRGHDLIHGGRGHDHIHGGPGNDHMRGGHHHDRIHGGAGRDRLEGGGGDDQLIDRQGATVADGGPGRNYVDVADGNRDRVLCADGSSNRIVVDRGDRLHPACRGAASRVTYGRPSNAAPTDDRAANATQSRRVSGSGTNNDPYTAECTNPSAVDCVTPLFAARSLSGFWANEYVPAYKCPTSHPYLYDQKYNPWGTVLPRGVGVLGLGPIGMNINGVSTEQVGDFAYTSGTLTGALNSSATNWTFGTNSYQLQLHCTSARTHATG
jgi:RTX calcium-binding nonapeptide repeat (4 copies)